MIGPETILSRLRDAVSRGDNDVIERCMIDMCWLPSPPMGDDFFDGLLAILHSEEFQQTTTATPFLSLIGYEWESLTEQQTERLYSVLLSLVFHMQDWVASFWILEFLGEHYPDERTLAAFTALRLRANSEQRELLVTGFFELARNSVSPAIPDRVCEQLTLLSQDSTKEVRLEATIKLRRLGGGKGDAVT
jgi:hypothetical protein